MKRLSIFLFLLVSLGLGSSAQTGISVPELAHCDQAVLNFLNTYDIPGATLAIARNGELIYSRGFGYADLAKTEPVQPHHMFRIASVSKPITSIAIMKLTEEGQLSLSDQVFGPTGLLAQHPYLSTVSYSDTRLEDITVQHLLEHTAGWNRNTDCVQEPATPYSWAINHCDPIGFPLHVTHTLNETNPVREEVLIRFLMEKGLDFAPGTQYAYSNIGYLVLGEIIAQLSGKSYEAYVQEEVLAPLGICDMHIGKNLLADKRAREAEYQGNGYNSLSIYGDNTLVPWEYGGWNLEAMDAHGGWIATARDLVRLLSAVDGFSTRPDLLSAASIGTMTTPSTQASYYAKGWSVNSANNWWHTGALDGTASIWVRTSGGFLWAFILNKRIIDGQSNAFWSDLDNLPWGCVTQASAWPGHDLFEVPESSQGLSISRTGDSSAMISWTNGTGTGRLLSISTGDRTQAWPLDGQMYPADPNWDQGGLLGAQTYAAYSGAGNQVQIEGLDPNATYQVALYEYRQDASTGNLPVYQLCNAPEQSFSLQTTHLNPASEMKWRISPNPGSTEFVLTQTGPLAVQRLEIRDLQGKVLEVVYPNRPTFRISTVDFPAQVYILSAFGQEGYLGSQSWIKR